MVLSFTFTLSFITVLVFYLMPKYTKKPFLINAIIFMVISIVTKNYLTIMTMVLKLIKTTEDDFLFIALLLYREIMIPFLVLIFLNQYFLHDNKWKKTFVFCSFLITIHGIEIYMVYFKVINYINWNLSFALIVNFSLLFLSIAIWKLLFILEKKEL